MECVSAYRKCIVVFICIHGLVLLGPILSAAETFRLASFNLENYLLTSVGGRPAKPEEAKAEVRATLKAVNADVVAFQEIGGADALEELQSSLAREGLHYPYREIVAGHDPHIFVAVLSRLPIVARRAHTNESFLLLGRRFFVSRGFLEVDLKVGPTYGFTLLAAHLKSRRAVPEADEAELREQEAKLLRERVDALLTADPKANLVVLGDFNDTKDSRAIRALLGRGNRGLIDTRPAESETPGAGESDEESFSRNARSVNWTHYFAKEDSYSRIDYILISHGMYHEWVKSATRVVARPRWGIASDHRPVVATFTADDYGRRP